MQKEQDISKKYYYTISFLEGASVMVIELLGAKIIAPYYGASLYVWSSVLGVTLGGLALGYFLGGYATGKFQVQKLLFTVLLLGAFFSALAPIIAPKIMYLTDSLGVRWGSFFSVLLYLSPSMICMGMVSPLIIQLVSEKESAGKAAGTVYAISTLGGILATFLFGFYLIPEIGIRASAYLTGGILGFIAITYFILTGRFKHAGAALLMLLILKLISPHYSFKTERSKIQYQSEGLLGQLTIIDYKYNPYIKRALLLDGIMQTTIQKQSGWEPISFWTYPHKIAAISCIKPAGSKALLLGMGGGSIAFELVVTGFDLDIVELDERIPKIARKYFNYNPQTSNLIIDDARHYIRKANKKYDLVVFDLLRGECQPSYIFTTEGLNELKKILNKDALVIINFQGTLAEGDLSKGTRSVYKTLLASGFYIKFKEQDQGERKESRDLFFIASENDYDFKSLLEKNERYYKKFALKKFKYEDLITDQKIGTSDAYVLTDDKPMLELLNTPIILAWRKNVEESRAKKFVESGMPLY